MTALRSLSRGSLSNAPGIRDFALVAGELKRHLVGAFHGLPSARLVAGHGAVFLQGDVDGLVHAAIDGARLIGDLLRALEIAGLVVRHHLVIAGDVGGLVALLVGLGARVFVRCGHQPSVGGRQQLVHAHLMLFAGTGETGMVHEVSGAVVVNERGIVALGDFDVRVVVAAPLDRAHQALADVALPVVADGLGGNRGVAGLRQRTGR